MVLNCRRWVARAGSVVAALIVCATLSAQAYAQLDGPPADRAEELLQQGYVLHILGAYDQAIDYFTQSIKERPTAEGYTFRGWSLSFLERFDEAIAECKKAIEIDPEYGNPYNDIGVYLIKLGRSDEAIPWLEKAIRAKRYCCYQYPHTNLGRVHLKNGNVAEAKRLFEKALEIDPEYVPAQLGLKTIRESFL